MTVVSGETMALSTSLNTNLSTCLSTYLSTCALFGYAVVSGFLLALTLATQRWLWWLVGAILYWLGVDKLYRWLSSWLPLTDWECYVLAMGLCWLPFALWILYRILRYGSVSHVKAAKIKLADITVKIDAKRSHVEAAGCKSENLQPRNMKPKSITDSATKHNAIEHSPVYNANFQPRFR
ncbi:hypothetical protein [Psychrobacter sp. 16-MNA-CIBAN-0192]|uniref:hypothetical protein n=1 Tax=Psychrobacter sp. 16-MNA-CIBAN-0192 TaxID=3140448 RepID=UPI003332A105